jgi:DNA gyrase subunit B
MEKLLLDLGRESCKLILAKDKTQYNDNQFKDILLLMVEIEKLAKVLEKRGIGIKKFLELRHPKTKKYPVYWVKVEGQDHFVYSDEELAKIKKQEELSENDFTDLYESDEVAKIVNQLDKFGIEPIDLFVRPPLEVKVVKKEKAKPLFKVEMEKGSSDFFALKEVLDFIRQQAKKGMTVSRYKGLGEMNPEQLWETTMDPAKRTMMKIALEDAVEADRIFTTLMGDMVEPRREFIESYAHEVKNLDI